MPAAIAIPALIGAGTSIVGGIMGSHSASKAANQQAAGGQQAIGGINAAVGNANNLVGGAASAAGTGAVNAAGAAKTDVDNAAANSANTMNTAATNAANGVVGAANTAATGVTNAANAANGLLDPYVQMGAGSANTLRAGLAPGGDLMKQFTANDMQSYDPGYQFRIDQGNQALQRSAAARGGVMGGGVMKALDRYSQGQASSEFENAFNRFQTNRMNTYGMLAGTAGMGMTAANQSGQNTLGAARYGGDIGFAGQQYAGNVGLGAAQFNGSMGMNAAQYGGNVGINAAQYSGNAGMNAANTQSNNLMGGAEYNGNVYQGIGNAQAGATLRSGNAWGQAINGVGGAAAQYFGSKANNGVYSNNGNYMGTPGFGSPGAVNAGSSTIDDYFNGTYHP